jgi:tetratricopeptide (TPR) repeat protein
MAGKRLLLVLDNVSDTEQVVPLLPGSADSLVLVTSRRGLGDIPSAVPVPLSVLSEDEAVTMFVRLAPRAAAERSAVAELVAACGCLPLAVSIIASVFLRHRSWSVADVVAEVHRSGGGGPLTLTAEDRTVAAVFDLSYQRLPADRQRMFRLLAMHPGGDVDPYAAAAMAGMPVERARQHLDGLHTDHLLEEPVYRRYGMHDLIRAYARNLTAADPDVTCREVVGRLLDFYRHTAAIATDLAYPYERRRRPTVARADVSAPVLADRHQAERWLDLELDNLLAAASHAAGQDQPEDTWHLAAVLDRHLRTRGRYRDAQILHQHALDLADRLGDDAARIDALNGLGHAAWVLGRYEQAGDCHERALRLARAIGDPIGEYRALHGLGDVHRRQSRNERAAEHFRQALRIAQRIGDRGGESNALNGLGYVHRVLGRYEQAVDHFKRALRIARAIGDRGGEGNALNGLGHVHLRLGRNEDAGAYFGRALRITRAIGERGGESIALNGLGYVHRVLGRYEDAVDYFGQALRIVQAIGDRGGESSALNGLGYVHWMLGRHEQAGGHFGRALQIAGASGDSRGDPQALNGLGHVHRMLGRYGEAADCYQQLLALAQQRHSTNWQYEALQGMGRLHHAEGRPDLALACHERALELATAQNQATDQARAHDGLAHAYHAAERHEPARRHWQHALDILTRLGTDHTEDIEANVPNIRAHLGKGS